MFRRLSFLPVPAGLILAVLCAASPAARAESLEDVVQSALNGHPSVEDALAQRDQAVQEKREKFSGYFPEVRVNGTAGRIYGDNSTSRGLSVTRGAGYSGLGEGGVTVTEMLFDGFETQNRVDAAQARRMSASNNVEDVRENLALRATQAYLDLMRADAVLTMAKEYDTKVDDYLSRIKTKVDEGASDKAELQQAKDIKLLLGGIILDYDGQYKAAVARYTEASGHLPEGPMTKPSPKADIIPATEDDAIAYARAHHPLLKAADYTADASGYEIDAETASLYPDLNAEASYDKKDQADLIGGESVDARAVLKLNWTFSTGGAQLARIDRKRLEREQFKARAEAAGRQIESTIRSAYAEMGTAKRQVALNDERIKVQEELFDTYKAQFEGAKISLLQLMQAENQLFNARMESINSDYRLLSAQYGVLAGMGRLQESMNIVPIADASNTDKTWGIFPLGGEN